MTLMQRDDAAEYFTSSYKLVYLGKLLHRVTIM